MRAPGCRARDGIVREPDNSEAERWFRRMAQAGDPEGTALAGALSAAPAQPADGPD